MRNNPVLRHKLFQIDYLTTQQQPLSLLYHKALNDEWREQAERCAMRYGRKTSTFT